MPRFRFILALLATVAIAFISNAAMAETSAHGFSIPTVEHEAGPTLEVCTPTGTWWSSGSGHPGTVTASRVGSYGVALCRPAVEEGGVRPSYIPKVVREALTLIESSVNFDHDSFSMSEDAIAAVRVVSAWMAEVPAARLIVAGHTDATGTEEYNVALSESRARAVAGFLAGNGVDSERIDVEWYGETMLLIDSLVRDRANRRVTITPVVE